MSEGAIIWEHLCGLKEDDVSIWKNGDFNPCFEKFVFSALPHFILAVASSFHFSRHQHLRRRGLITRYLLLHIRQSICTCLLLSSLFLFAIEYAYYRKPPHLVSIIWGLVYVVCWFVHSGYVWRLHRLDHHSLRGHWSVVLGYVFVLAGHLVLLATAIKKRLYDLVTLDDFEEIFVYSVMVFHIGYSLTLLKGERRRLEPGLLESPPQNEGLSTRDRGIVLVQECPEDYSWFLAKIFFCWLNPLMMKGHGGNIKDVKDLFDLPENLQTRKVLQKFYQVERAKNSETVTTFSDGLTQSILGRVRSPNPTDHLSRSISLHSPYPLHPSSVSEVEVICPHARREKEAENSHPIESMKDEKKRKALLSLLISTFGLEYFSLGILKLFSDICSFSNPIILNLLILFMSNEEGPSKEPLWHGFLYCGALFSLTFFGSVASTHFEYFTSRVALKFRAVIINCIYRKTLSVSQVSLRGSFDTGEIVNLMSTDADRVVGFCSSFHQFWSLPVQVAVVLYLLYLQMGLAFLSGVVFAVMLVPVNRWIAIKIGQLSQTMMTQKDARVKFVNETLQGIRTVKFHAWEGVFAHKIESLRALELSSLKKRKYLDALCVFFWATTPIAISILTFTTYVLMGNSLTAAKVFTSISLFAILITPLNAFPWVLNGLMEARVSVKRIQRLLDLCDLQPRLHYDLYLHYLGFLPSMSGEPIVKMKNASFAWGNNICTHTDQIGLHHQPSMSLAINTVPSSHNDGDEDSYDEVLLGRDDDGDEHRDGGCGLKFHLCSLYLEIHEGMFVGVIGEVGSGKSSLLSAILGEMRRIRNPQFGHSEFALGFPLDEGFGYFPQEPWIQRGTLRDNILFGRSYNVHKFAKVIRACALDEDIANLPDGEMTLIGENGSTLSGGQKARVSLARTAYQEKKFYLLDDPYAAVDSQVALRIHSECIMGRLGHTTRILVTHHIRFLHDADMIVVMEKGKIVRSGPPSKVGLEAFGQADEDDKKNKKNDDDNHDDDLIIGVQKPRMNERASFEAAWSKDEDKQTDDDDDDDEFILNKDDDDDDDEIDCDDYKRFNTVTQNWVKEDDERRMEGGVNFKVYATYWTAVGSYLAVAVLLSLFLMQASRNTCDWWLSYWVTHAVNQSHFDPNITDQYYSSSDNNFSLIDLKSKLGSDWSGEINNPSVTANLMNEFYRSSIVILPQGDDGLVENQLKLHTFHKSVNRKESQKQQNPISSKHLYDNKNKSNYLDDYIHPTDPSDNNNYYTHPTDVGNNDYTDSIDYNNHTIKFYLTVYACLAAFNAVATIFRAVLFAYGGIEAARTMHSKLVDGIFKATIKFFDTCPLGRIINRFSSDTFSVDDSLPFVLNIFLAQSFGLLGSVIICCYGLPFSALIILFLTILYYFIQRYYRCTSRELKRISCITLSPVYVHFSESLNGLSVIRAHRQSSRFEHEALTHLDLNLRAQFASNSISQWLSIRLQMIGVALVTCISIMAVLQKEFGAINPGLVGLAISYVLSITNLLGSLVLSFTETEKLMIPVERVHDYTSNIPHEEDPSHNVEIIPPLWPFVGVVSFKDVTLKYGPHLTDALNNVTFETYHGERVGVVGRTGSGKSSLFLALMRMVSIWKGKIYIDGVDVHLLPLREYRSRISMIPQDPFLFGGTIKENLDPAGKYSDEAIKQSLVRCNMLEVIESAGGLSSKVEEKGQQFSMGQRQLLCLARTMLSESQILCIDEATANVDMATDRMLQTTIRRHFKGKTVITIAHRIETILDCNRIIVMSRGRLVEFDTPSNLLKNPKSLFAKLVNSARKAGTYPSQAS